ncbi:exonuclease [Natrialbaceae archaeon A-arb3/5]
MSTDGRSADAVHATAEGDLESAGFVQLVTRADGDALAASGIIARALTACETPFQVSVGRTVAERTQRVRTLADESTGGDDRTLVVGAVDAEASRLDADERPAVLAAVDLVRGLDKAPAPDPVLALAGLVAAGVEPGAGESEWLLDAAHERGLVERRPGVAVPTADPVDGVAHSTRLRAPWSGDADETREALSDVATFDTAEELSADDRRAVGSLAALDTVGSDESAAVAATAVQRVLSPYATPENAFETVGGYAEVLEATARLEPGTGAALAMGHDACEPALSAWREYGRRAHSALETASTSRYDGLVVIELDDESDLPVEAIAELGVNYRSVEPTVLAVGTGEAALATRGSNSLGAAVERIARELASSVDDAAGVEYDVGHRRGYLRYDPSMDDSTIITTVREEQ